MFVKAAACVGTKQKVDVVLNLWRLRIFKELADLGTMTAVSETLRLTRPAVSQHIAQLEREVGIALIERTPQGIRLTEAGLRLAVQAKELLFRVEEIEADVARAQGRVSGALKIAAFGTFAATVIPTVIQRLITAYPELEPAFVELEPADAVKSLLSRQVDIAVVDDLVAMNAASDSLEYHPLMRDGFLTVVASSHPLADRSSIRLRELANENWVINESASAYHGFVMNACLEAGFAPKVVCSCRSAGSAISFVRSGWAIAVLPGLSARVPVEGVSFIPIKPGLTRNVTAAISRGSARRPSIAAVLAELRRESDKQ